MSSNIPINSRSMNGIITISDGTTIMENGNIENCNTINANDVVSAKVDTQSIILTDMTLNGSLHVGNYNDIVTDITPVSFLCEGKSYLNGDVFVKNVPYMNYSATNKTYVDSSVSSVITTINSSLLNYASLAGTNSFTGSNTFSNLTFNNVSSNITVSNNNFSSTTAGNNTPIFSGVSGVNSITGWTFNSSVYSVYVYNATNTSPNHRYVPNYPSPSTTYCGFEKTNGTTFVMATSGLTLSIGDYTASWSSYWGVSTTSGVITASCGNGSLTYNDSGTRSTGTWGSQSFQFSVTSTGTNNLTFTYTSTVAEQFDAFFSNVIIVKYNDFRITDGTNIAFVSPTLSKLNNTTLTGSTILSGTATVQGTLTAKSLYGTNNLVMNNTFSSNTLGSTNSNCLSIGNIVNTLPNNCSNIIAMGNSFGISNTTTNTIGIGNSLLMRSSDTIIGTNCGGLGGNNALVGFNIGNNACCGSYNVGIGNSLFGAYNGFAYYVTQPLRNVAIGTNLFASLYDNFNIAIGYNSLNALAGNNNNPSSVSSTALITQYNISLGYNNCNTQGNLNNMILLGNNLTATNAITNSILIGNSITSTASNQIILGSNTQTTYIAGNFNVSGTSTIAGYLTSALATSTYQTIAGMSAYQTIAGMSSYLTSASSISDSQLSSNIPRLGGSGSQSFTGTNTFSSLIVNSPLQLNPFAGACQICDNVGNSIFAFFNSWSSLGIGYASLQSAGTNTISSVAVGHNALTNASLPRYCIAIGYASLGSYNNTSISNHGMIGIGFMSLYYASTSTLTTAIGYNTGLNITTGSNNTFIGANSDLVSATQYSNSTAIGYNSKITASNVIILGTSTETTVIPSAKINYGGAYLPNSTFFTLSDVSPATGAYNWNTTPPTNFSKYIMFSAVTSVSLTLPQISNSAIFEGMEFIFRRTNTASGSTSTSALVVYASGSDTIFGRVAMIPTISATILDSTNSIYYCKLVCVNKTTTPYNWAFFPS